MIERFYHRYICTRADIGFQKVGRRDFEFCLSHHLPQIVVGYAVQHTLLCGIVQGIVLDPEVTPHALLDPHLESVHPNINFLLRAGVGSHLIHP